MTQLVENLEDKQNYIKLRAEADSEALKIKFSDKETYNQNIPKNTASKKLYDISEKIRYEILGTKILKCKSITRSDFRFDENFGSDGLFILEINTQPGMTSTSLVPELFSRIGFSFNDLVISLLEDASCNR